MGNFVSHLQKGGRFISAILPLGFHLRGSARAVVEEERALCASVLHFSSVLVVICFLFTISWMFSLCRFCEEDDREEFVWFIWLSSTLRTHRGSRSKWEVGLNISNVDCFFSPCVYLSWHFLPRLTIALFVSELTAFFISTGIAATSVNLVLNFFCQVLICLVLIWWCAWGQLWIP